MLKLVFVIGICLTAALAVPAYPGSTFTSWDTQPTPQQLQPQRKTPPGQKRTLQNVVRQHINDLDTQTQHDLKVLGYLEKELNKIFSCYIQLSCARTRTQKVLSECDEIKDWPLYHQVMKMAGIRKYPFQSYAPTQSRRVFTTTELPDMNQNEDTTDVVITGFGDETFAISNNNEDDDGAVYQQTRPTRHRSVRRIRRGHKGQQHTNQNHLNGVPVTNEEAQQ